MFGSKKTGPDLSWADDDLDDPNDSRNHRALSPPSNVPGPTFPPRTYKHQIRTPKPLSPSERAAVSAQLEFRARCREGPLFTVLDRASLLVDGVSRRDVKRRAFDPFEGQERWGNRHVKKRRTEPDLKVRAEYGYSLNMFPEELWGVLDPAQTNPIWKTVGEDSVAYASLGRKVVKKKRRKAINYDLPENEDGGEGDESDDEVRAARQKRRKESRAVGERSGMEAEDEMDHEREPDEEDGDEEEVEPEDSELEEDSDDNDYNAELYFDGGEDDMDGFADEAGMDDF